MSTLRTLPWAKFGFEGVLIVVSILAAFWIDSWREDRQLATEEQELLRQLKAEFEVNIDLLAERRSRHAANHAAARSLLSVTSPNPDTARLHSEIFRQDLHKMQLWWTFDPRMGVLNGIIQSGKLAIISSDSLRTNLASWPARLQDLTEDELFLAGFAKDSIYPILRATTAMRNYVLRPNVGPSAFPDNFEELLRNREFENVVIQKLAMTDELLDMYDDIGAQIDSALALIEEEIDIE